MNLDGNENEMIVANNYVTAEQIADHRWSPITELPAIFFAKVGAAVMLNRKRLCRFPFLLDNNTMAYSLSPTKWDADFAKALFGTVDLTSLVQVGALPSYNAGDVESMGIYLPSLFEQEQIGAFFKLLDNLITLHQRQPFLLSTPNISLSVRLIHPFYTSSWEQRKVGDLLIERNQQAPMSDEYPLMAFIANEGVAPKGERYDRSALVTDTVNKLYKKTEKGDFIYSSNNLETGSIGLNKYGKACISPVYSIFEPTGIADSDFLGRRLVRKDFINAMVKWRQGVIYGQWRIHESDFLKIEITVPSVEEQRKIGTYLDQLDHLITLHQRKGKAAVSGCFLNCFSLEKSSAQSRTLELFGQISNQEIKYIIDGLSILGGKLRNFCVKLIILLSYTRINDIAKYHISRNTECVHNIN